jgi:signal transduction histidine kinase
MTEAIVETLRSVSLLSGLSDEDLRSIADSADICTLDSGELLFKEGDVGDSAYVILSGTLEILKRSEGADVHLADRGEGEVIGEIALLLDEGRSASVRATEGTRLLVIKRSQLEELIEDSPDASRALFLMMLDRWRNTESKVRHSARMAQLGTLSAGLAHELNNPAAAMESAALRLPDSLRNRDEAWAAYQGSQIPPSTQDVIDGLRTMDRSDQPKLTGLDRTDREEEVAGVLDRLGVPDPWNLSAGVVDLGLSDEELEKLAAELSGEQCAATLSYLCAQSALEDLFRELRLGAKRISDVVAGVKRYSYLDQAPIQPVDIVQQLEDTLVVLGNTLDGIEVVREFEEGIPEIEANGRELAQVWTNIIDNAVYAIKEAQRDQGVITLRASTDHSRLRVEIEDNGTGIPEDLRDCIFDPFFTTKPPGAGPGLGLHNAHSIVADHHGGTLELESDEGWARFVATLPLEGA